MADISSQLHAGYAHELTRELQQPPLLKSHFMYPLFITDIPNSAVDLPSMPGQKRWSVDRLADFLAPLVAKGLRSVILFGIPEVKRSAKDGRGSIADDPEGPVIQAIKLLRKEFPDLYIACDVCLCEYTDHGHCGVLHEDGTINNVPSVQRLAEVAVNYARAGAHCVAPSDMMDGRIKAIKQGLLDAGLAGKTTLMSYSAKFASALYGPFRDAVDSAPSFGDRRCYQLPPGARGLARRAITRDLSEGADMIMVKPTMPYLDVISEARQLAGDVPLACYQVSGEFAMIHAGARANVYELRRMAEESVMSARRAGATLILSYFTPQFLEWLPA